MKKLLSKMFISDKGYYKKLLFLSVPIIAQNLITVGVNIMDTVMLGKLAEAQISASSLAGSYMNLFHIVCMGLGGGTAVMASQFYGEGDMRSFRKVMTIVIRFSFVIGALGTLVTLLFPRQIMTIYSNEEHVIEYGVQYLRIVAFSMLFMLLTIPVTLVLRSAGKAQIPLYSAAGAFVLNIIINYIFIFGHFGAPRMEIAGAALGTVVSYAFQLVFVYGYVLFVDKNIGYRLKNLMESTKEYTRSYLRYSVPVIISDTILALGTNMVSVIMGHIGASFVAAYAIISTMVRLTTTFTQGFSYAGGVIIGNTLGTGDEELTYRQGVTCFWISITTGVVVGAILMAIGSPYINYYNISEDTRATAMQLLYAAAVNGMFQVTANMLTKGVLRGGGDTRWLMVMDVIFLWCVSVPFGALAGLVWHFPAFWIYTLLRADPLLKTVVGTQRLFSRKWINRVRVGESAS